MVCKKTLKHQQSNRGDVYIKTPKSRWCLLFLTNPKKVHDIYHIYIYIANPVGSVEWILSMDFVWLSWRTVWLGLGCVFFSPGMCWAHFCCHGFVLQNHKFSNTFKRYVFQRLEKSKSQVPVIEWIFWSNWLHGNGVWNKLSGTIDLFNPYLLFKFGILQPC